jgi:hypothetical protein
VPHTPMPQRHHVVVPRPLVDMSTRIWQLPARLIDFGQACCNSIDSVGREGIRPPAPLE